MQHLLVNTSVHLCLSYIRKDEDYTFHSIFPYVGVLLMFSLYSCIFLDVAGDILLSSFLQLQRITL